MLRNLLTGASIALNAAVLIYAAHLYVEAGKSWYDTPVEIAGEVRAEYSAMWSGLVDAWEDR